MPRDVGIETVQNYFKLIDINKELLLNAYTNTQKESALRFQKHLNDIINSLYVPKYQSVT